MTERPPLWRHTASSLAPADLNPNGLFCLNAIRAAGSVAAAVFDITTKIISGHLALDVALILPDASLIDDLGADSLDTVELVIAFEEAFGIEITQDDAERIHTVNDAVEYVRSKVRQK